MQKHSQKRTSNKSGVNLKKRKSTGNRTIDSALARIDNQLARCGLNSIKKPSVRASFRILAGGVGNGAAPLTARMAEESNEPSPDVLLKLLRR